MSNEPLLSDLCSICNINKSKYRCPGCSARTCSLPCYKRHQQWAQCSGQRDPTKFVKKSQLVTPAGIDHDFNFLTGIERNIEKAEKGLANSHVADSSRPRSWSQQQSSQKGQTNYLHLESAGVRIIRAPKGLSRQKENRSHRSSTKKSTGGRNIMWTVEWFDSHKTRQLTETSSTCQIAVAQPFAPREQQKAKKRKRDTEHVTNTGSASGRDGKPTPEDQSRQIQLGIDDNDQVANQEREPPSSESRSAQTDTREIEQPQAHLSETTHANHRDDGSNTKPTGGEYRFFLLKPRTTSSRHVLIPLEPTATLGECLNGRTVLEFPTIYVFPQSVEQLPEEFMLEQDYLKQEGEDQKEFQELIGELDPEILKRLRDDGRQSETSRKEEEVDSNDILDVLKKDVHVVL